MNSGDEEKLRAAIYTRISRDFRGDGAGVERQLEDCLWFCERKKYIKVAEYCDNSRSAFQDRNHRPEYEKMLSDFRKGKFDIIVVWRVDRLTRSTYGMVDMIRELEPLGLRLYADDLGQVDLSYVEGRNRAIERAMRAEEESARKSERQKRANLQRAQRGKIKRGTRCFGFDGEYNIIEEEAAVVRAIYHAYSSGVSMSAITRAINGENPDMPDFPQSEPPNVIIERERRERRKRLNLPEPAPRLDGEGKPIPKKKLTTKWTLAATQSILRNPRYAGYVYYNPVDKEGKCHPTNGTHWRDCIVVDPKTKKRVKAAWDAIVDPNEWETVQRLRDKNRIRKDKKPINRDGSARKYFGSGVYRCGICGAPVRSGDKSYRCDGHVNRMREKVDEYVLAVIRERLSMPDLADALAQNNDSPRLNEIEKEASRCRAEIQRARDDYKAHRIDGELYQEIDEEQQAILDRLDRERLSLMPDNPCIVLMESENPVEAFDAISEPGQIAKIIDFLATIKLMPNKRGRRQTPERLRENVIIEWK